MWEYIFIIKRIFQLYNMERKMDKLEALKMLNLIERASEMIDVVRSENVVLKVENINLKKMLVDSINKINAMSHALESYKSCFCPHQVVEDIEKYLKDK